MREQLILLIFECELFVGLCFKKKKKSSHNSGRLCSARNSLDDR